MTPHRRRYLTEAILEIKGTLSDVTAEQLLVMPDGELLALYIELENAFDSANITEPHGQMIESMETVIMPAVGSDSGGDGDGEESEIIFDLDDD